MATAGEAGGRRLLWCGERTRAGVFVSAREPAPKARGWTSPDRRHKKER